MDFLWFRSGLALSKRFLGSSPAGHKGPRDGSWVSSDRDLSIPKQIVFAAVGAEVGFGGFGGIGLEG